MSDAATTDFASHAKRRAWFIGLQALLVLVRRRARSRHAERDDVFAHDAPRAASRLERARRPGAPGDRRPQRFAGPDRAPRPQQRRDARSVSCGWTCCKRRRDLTRRDGAAGQRVLRRDRPWGRPRPCRRSQPRVHRCRVGIRRPDLCGLRPGDAGHECRHGPLVPTIACGRDVELAPGRAPRARARLRRVDRTSTALRRHDASNDDGARAQPSAAAVVAVDADAEPEPTPTRARAKSTPAKKRATGTTPKRSTTRAAAAAKSEATSDADTQFRQAQAGRGAPRKPRSTSGGAKRAPAARACGRVRPPRRSARA